MIKRFVRRRTNLYIITYAVIETNTGDVLVPIEQTQWGRSKYMPHMGLKQRIKALRSLRINVPVDFLLEGADDERPLPL